MLLGKVVRLATIPLVAIALLYFVASKFLGPGVSDFSTPIANGYEFNDSGGYERNIIYLGEEADNEIVVGSRVDDYKLVGNKLFVARRPREVYRVDGVAKSRLSKGCEYWVIDVTTHLSEQISEPHGLQCNY